MCISVERAFTLMKDVHFNKTVAIKTLKVSRWMICIAFFVNILTTFHRLFYLKLMDEPTFDNEPQGHPWCVLNFHRSPLEYL